MLQGQLIPKYSFSNFQFQFQRTLLLRQVLFSSCLSTAFLHRFMLSTLLTLVHALQRVALNSIVFVENLLVAILTLRFTLTIFLNLLFILQNQLLRITAHHLVVFNVYYTYPLLYSLITFLNPIHQAKASLVLKLLKLYSKLTQDFHKLELKIEYFEY